MIKLIFAALTVGGLAAMTGCDVHRSHLSSGWSDASLQATTNLVQTAGIPAGLKGLTVDNRFGTIQITGTDQGATGWTWKLTIRARTNSVAQHIASGASCKAELNGDQLRLVVTLPDTQEPHRIQSDFEISVPKSVTVRTQNHFGGTQIASLASDVEATDENGRLTLRDISGRVRARTSFDTLTVSNTGPATLNDQNGELRATDISGPLEATTRFASLLAKDIRGSAVLNNQNGEIKASAIQGRLDATTRFDTLTARDVGAAAILRNQNGRIEATEISGSLDAKTSFDALVVREIGGPVHLRDQNGGIKLLQVRGDADLETSFDRLSAENIQGDAILKNQNGEVAASGITGSVKATTSFASLKITGAGKQFVCHNQNGEIRLDATSPTVAKIEAKTSFATLEVRLPAGLRPAIQAHTSFADVESDFPVLANPHGGDAFAGVDGGTARISLENQNGKIGIVRE